MDHIDSHDDIIPQNTRTVNINLNANQTFKVETKKYVFKPSYIQVGSGYVTDKTKRGYSMDFTEELLNMTPQEGFVFKLLMSNRECPDITKDFYKTNRSYIDSSTLTKSEKKKVYEGYTRLASKNLVIRISRGTYMINPRLVISNVGNGEDERRLYDDLVAIKSTIKPGDKKPVYVTEEELTESILLTVQVFNRVGAGQLIAKVCADTKENHETVGIYVNKLVEANTLTITDHKIHR